MRFHSFFHIAVPLLATAASAADGPIVDLKYTKYQGTFNSTLNLNIFRGIRYAAPPTGDLRWKLPQDPTPSGTNTTNDTLTPATANPPRCPWARRSLQYPKTAAEEAALQNFAFAGDEDCLFLNIFAPAGATALPRPLPVVVWIHGGGYNLDSASSFDFSSQITTNNNSYVAVVIQYRLGAFGFLSSEELVKGGGVANAGLWDMVHALRWVKTHVERIGCSTNTTSSSLLSCLQKADSLTLQNASDWVSTQGRYGQWEWRPVIDGKLVRDTLTQELSQGKAGVNGRRVLTSNVADEGPYFTWQNITTQAHFVSFLQSNYPALSAGNVSEILATYAQKHEAFLTANSKDANNTDPGFSTNGLESPYATTVSDYATGWQQVANNFYAEATFVCPSHWLANAYTAKDGARAWRYQYSVPPAYHGVDIGSGSAVDVLLAPVDTPGTAVTMPMRRALQNAWGQFITRGEDLVLGGSGGSATVWSQWKEGGRGVASMLNANMTGGVPVAMHLGMLGARRWRLC
ncbi:hypothetical protein COL516b_003942 [Colletotrichum fioriniae]|nr:uncharacterized protein COL516b_003942 [Colletotrichum fioriniae]KAJ0307329.1 hypothetical protein COL516b_003942 [Colletotrichum fioriniae]